MPRNKRTIALMPLLALISVAEAIIFLVHLFIPTSVQYIRTGSQAWKVSILGERSFAKELVESCRRIRTGRF